MRASRALAPLALACCLALAAQALESTSGAAPAKPASSAAQQRQSPLSMAASLVGALGSLLPGLVSNVAPLFLLVGLGALMMPALGLANLGLLREGRRSANDHLQAANPLNGGLAWPAAFAQYARPLQTSPQDIYYFTKRSLPSLAAGLSSAQLAHGVHELLERVNRAIENADKRYS